MDWLNAIEGLTDEHKTWATENKVESPVQLFDLARKPANWIESLDESRRGFVESKGFKELPAILDSYKNLESTVGVPPERLVKLPTKGIEEDPESWAPVFNRLGRPESPDGYDIKAPEGMEASDEVVKWAKDTFHQLGLTKTQGEKFIAAWNEMSSKHQAEMLTQKKYDDINAEKELRMKWGARYEKNVNGALGVAKQLGVKPEEVEALEQVVGKVRAFEILNSVSEKVGEADFVDGASVKDDTMTPAAAKYKIEQLKKDEEWVAKWMKGDEEKVQQMNRLVEMAYAPEFSRGA